MNPNNWQRIGAPPYSDRRIIETAENITKEYAKVNDISDPRLFTTSFDHIYENYIYPKFGIVFEDDCDLGFDDRGEKILGQYDPESNTACIDACLRPGYFDPRHTFTCWHEVGGHGILQGDWLRREAARLRQSRHIVTTAESIDNRTQSILERQANLFAAHAAAPTWFVRYVFIETFGQTRPIYYRGPRQYSFKVRKHSFKLEVEDFNHLCRIVADGMGNRFGGLSKEALGYRLSECGFVVNSSTSGLQLNRTARSSMKGLSLAPAIQFSASQLSSQSVWN